MQAFTYSTQVLKYSLRLSPTLSTLQFLLLHSSKQTPFLYTFNMSKEVFYSPTPSLKLTFNFIEKSSNEFLSKYQRNHHDIFKFEIVYFSLQVFDQKSLVFIGCLVHLTQNYQWNLVRRCYRFCLPTAWSIYTSFFRHFISITFCCFISMTLNWLCFLQLIAMLDVREGVEIYGFSKVYSILYTTMISLLKLSFVCFL